MNRGRPSLGPKIVQHLDGPAETRGRLETLLQTLAGQCSVQDACERLGISQARFHERPGLATQRTHRTVERNLRIAVIAFRRWTKRLGLPRQSAANHLGLSTRTLAYWEHHWNTDRIRVIPRGRPLERSDRLIRNSVIDTIHSLGPWIGVPTLEHFFPLEPRRQLENLLARFRRVYQEKHQVLVHILHWHRPGTVWAIDYTDPPTPIDRLYPHILAVRDLASGFQLLALPAPDQSAQTTCDALTALFRQHGRPLVLKSDNGSAFISEQTEQLLCDSQVSSLFSPPCTPGYNGACEAGIGSLKTHAHHHAARHGRPGEWTCDDVETARLLANATARPWGFNAPTPQVAWKHHSPVSPEDRLLFRQTLDAFRVEARAEHQADLERKVIESLSRQEQPNSNAEGPRPARAGPDPSGFVPTNHYDKALIDRVAVRRTLVAHGLLSFTGRRITPPIKPRKVARIA